MLDSVFRVGDRQVFDVIPFFAPVKVHLSDVYYKAVHLEYIFADPATLFVLRIKKYSCRVSNAEFFKIGPINLARISATRDESGK